MENRINYQIPDSDINAITDCITTLNEKLSFLVSLSVPEVKEIPKMADKTINFVKESINHAKENPELCPPVFKLNELDNDLKLILDLKIIYNKLLQLTVRLDETMVLAGTEAYQTAYVFYNSAKMAARMGIPNAIVIYNKLKDYFES